MSTMTKEFPGPWKKAHDAAEAWAQDYGTVLHVEAIPVGLARDTAYLCTVEYAPWV